VVKCTQKLWKDKTLPFKIEQAWRKLLTEESGRCKQAKEMAISADNSTSPKKEYLNDMEYKALQ
jgi:hypothetical protein